MALALPNFLALLKYLRRLLRELGSETSEKVSSERDKAWDRERERRGRELQTAADFSASSFKGG